MWKPPLMDAAVQISNSLLSMISGRIDVYVLDGANTAAQELIFSCPTELR